ncbi:MAG: thioredoxin-like domain-containing protein, partial [bacterium]|nr:thioredoxin-like domain-containing protein [bacterium]
MKNAKKIFHVKYQLFIPDILAIVKGLVLRSIFCDCFICFDSSHLQIFKKMKVFCFILLFVSSISIAQSQQVILGCFPQAVDKEIRISGFGLVGKIEFATTKADAKGNFKLTYPSDYVGASILEIKDSKSVIVLLNKENFEINWSDLEDFSILKFFHSTENSNLLRGNELYQNIEGKKSGLNYLIPLYASDPSSQSFLKNDLKVQNNLFRLFLARLPSDSYSLYYLKLRKLQSDMPLTASKYPEQFLNNKKEFLALDFGDKKMERSGLSADLFEGYVQLVENFYGADLEKVKIDINSGIDSVLKNLKDDPLVLQEVAQKMFNFLEKRSLFGSAEYLALSILDEGGCQLDEKHTALFEQYRKMALGRVAADIVFPEAIEGGYRKLSDIHSKYKLVVFGASWCPKCTEELPKLKSYYDNWKKDGLEIVFVSLDIDKPAFMDFIKDFPWL